MHQLSIRTLRTDASQLAAAGITLAIAVALALPTAVALCLASATAAASVDVRTGRLPNVLIAMAALPVVTTAVMEARAVPAAVGALSLALPLLALHLVDPEAMGFGDVKLAAALGGALGLLDPRLVVLALAAATGGSLAVALVRRRRSLPFGPGLVVGAFAASVAHAASAVTW